MDGTWVTKSSPAISGRLTGSELFLCPLETTWESFVSAIPGSLSKEVLIYILHIYIYLCVYMCCMYVYIYVTCGYLYIFIYVIFNFTLTLCDHIHLYSQSGWFGPFFQGSQTTFFTNLRPWCQLLAVKGFWMRRYLRLASKAYGIFV